MNTNNESPFGEVLYSKGRPGNVVDPIVPLKRGGKDAPSNMPWQTKAEAKKKQDGVIITTTMPDA